MEVKMRKPLTPAQREAKNAKDRARRAGAGKKPAPAKKPVKKPVAKKPVATKPAKKVASAKHAPKPTKVAVPKNAPLGRIQQNGITKPGAHYKDGRPKPGLRIWQIADEIAAKLGRTPTRAEVWEACKAEKIVQWRFVNEFYHWRKFYGINGRTKKDGTPAKVTGGPRIPHKAPPVKVKKQAGKPSHKKKPVAAKKAVKPPVIVATETQTDLPNVNEQVSPVVADATAE